MIKQIIKYVCVITCLSFLFYGISYYRCKFDNDYSSRTTKSFSISPQLAEKASITDAGSPTLVSENKEDDLFDGCYYTLFLNDTTKEY